ncbi:hypothetical protein D3C75_815990 [compost metagenome]
MKLVADGAFGAVGETECGFKPQCVRMLVAAEFAPRGMEFAGHAEKFHAQRLGVPCRQREVIVAPASGGERFQLEMAVDMDKITAAPLLMTVVVIDRKTRLHIVDSLPYAACIVQISCFA